MPPAAPARPPARPAPRLRRARAAVAAYFAANAVAFALWAARVPEVKARLNLSDARLGVALLTVALGALASMQFAGRAVDRAGAAAVTRVAGALMPLSLAVPGYARSFGVLCAGLGLLGALSGVLDVAMNARGVEVERAYGRPIFSSLHGVWSLSAAAGGALGGMLLQAHLATSVALAGPGILLSLATLPAAVALDGGAADGAGAGAGADVVARARGAGERGSSPPLRRVALLGVLAFAALLAEGTAVDWSAVHLRDELGARGGAVALGFTFFEVTMTVERFLGDRLVARFGRRAMLRAGGAVAAGGLLLVSAARAPGAAVLGWALAGAGIAHMVPQLFGAAGDLSHRAGRTLARVATLGYLGLLAGPPLVGAVADATSLRIALWIPAALAALVALLAGRAVGPRAG